MKTKRFKHLALYYRWFCLKQVYGNALAKKTSKEVPTTHVCQNCKTTFQGNYCSVCGQIASTHRLCVTDIFSNVIDIFLRREQGLLHTCLEIIYRPGYMVRNFIDGKRTEYTRPIKLLFILTTLYVLLHYALYLHAETLEVSDVLTDKDVAILNNNLLWHYLNKCREAIFTNHAYTALFTTIIMLLPVHIAFCKTPMGRQTNLVELFYALAYLSCFDLIVSIFQMPFNRIMGVNETGVSIGYSFTYSVFFFHQFYRIGWLKTIGRLMFSYAIMLVAIVLICIIAIACYVGVTKM